MKFISFVGLILAMFSTNVFAHAGHDHNSPMAFFEHLIWMAPMVIAVAGAFYWFETKKHNHKD